MNLEILAPIVVVIFVVIANLLNWIEKNKKEERDAEIHQAVQKMKEKPYVKNYYGDVFENIKNSTIVNSSTVFGSIDNIQKTRGSDISNILLEITNIIHQNENQEAADLFEAFTLELEKEGPKKPILKSLWEGIEKALPVVGGIIKTAAAFKSLVGLV
jgi:hypothetical protein